ADAAAGIVRIRDLGKADLDAAAALLVDLLPNGWPSMREAKDEVRSALERKKIKRGAFLGRELVGWIGGVDLYPGHVVELHPLVVRHDHQKKGVGRALVTDLEVQVRARGATTIFVGTDDERGQTSLAGADLYPDPLAHLAALRDTGGHAFSFFRRCGFTP